MAKRRKNAEHAHRALREDGKIECECGDEFDDDPAWRKHYESKTTKAQQRTLEGRDDEETDADES